MVYTWVLRWLRVGLVITVLGVCSWCDLRHRVVSDLIWILSYPLAILLCILSFTYGALGAHISLLFLLLLISAMALLSLLLYFSGFLGGADAFALVFIAIAFPDLGKALPVAFTTFFNSILIMGFGVPLVILILNIWRRNYRWLRLVHGSALSKVLLLITAYPKKLSDISSHETPAVRAVETRDKRVVLVPRHFYHAEHEDPQEALRSMLDRLPSPPPRIWVTPFIPAMPFLLAGFILAVLGIDFLWLLVSLV